MKQFNQTYNTDSSYDLERDIFEFIDEQQLSDEDEFEVIIRPVSEQPDMIVGGCNVEVGDSISLSPKSTLLEIPPQQTEEWKMVKYQIREEGFDYTFKNYSDWSEINDGEFHELRVKYLEHMKELSDYIKSECGKREI